MDPFENLLKTVLITVFCTSKVIKKEKSSKHKAPKKENREAGMAYKRW